MSGTRPGRQQRRSASSSPLAGAVHDAVERGTLAADELRADVDRVLGAFDSVVSELRSHVKDRTADDKHDRLIRKILEHLEKLRTETAELFDHQRARLSKFNVALFGRTGTGKSSLVEALTHGAGARISPEGKSDYTREVTAVGWKKCALWDTPGIEGWGRPDDDAGRTVEAGEATRIQLEREARRAVEVADVVVLVFDSSNQKPGEFQKVATWVRDLGKPVIAVLNVKNLPWRDPRHSVSQTVSQRRVYSTAVAEHVRNVRDGLGGIGLHDVPIIALSARRAVVARARTFRGPDGWRKSMVLDREQYGVERLAELSNITVLEDLVVGAIKHDAAGLRLGMLSDQLRGVAMAAAGTFERLEREARVIAEECDVLIERLLGLLGVPPAPKRGKPRRGTLAARVAELQELRGGTFAVRVPCKVMHDVERLCGDRLTKLRTEARGRVPEVVNKALREGKSVSPGSRLLDEDTLRAAVQGVVGDIAKTLRSQVDVVIGDSSADLRVRLATFEDVDGGAGSIGRAWGRALEIGGVAVQALSVWTAGFTAGFGAIIGAAVGWGMGRWGRKRRRAAEAERERTATAAVRTLRESVDETFDNAEADVHERCRKLVDSARAKLLPEVVDNCIALGRFVDETERARIELGKLLDRLDAAGVPAAILADAARELQQRRFPGDPSGAAKLWLGEDWIDDPDGLCDDAEVVPPEPSAARRATADRAVARRRFTAAWAGGSASPAPGAGREWLAAAATALRRDVAAREPLKELRRLASEPPRVVVCGDYNTGKSSLLRRLMLDSGADVPADLTVAALPETTAVSAYTCDGLSVVDTPGFQCGQDALGEVAAAAVQDASLVLFVFSPILLTGSSAALDAALRGDPERGITGKLDRTLFVINRCDDLGIDPGRAPDEYENICALKRRELAQVLRSRHMDVADDDPRVLTVAGDPYGLLGQRTDVTPEEFAATAAWDGVDRLRDALTAAGPTLERNGVDAALLDGGIVRIGALLRAARDEHEQLRAKVAELDGVRVRISDAIMGAKMHETSLAPTLERAISDELHALLQRAFAELGGERDALVKRLETWHEDKDIQKIATNWHRDAIKDIEHWADTTHADIENRIGSPSFQQAHPGGCGLELGYLKRERRRGRDAVGPGLVTTGEVTVRTGDVLVRTAATITDLDTGMTVVRAGSDLGFLGAIISGLELAYDVRQETKRDTRRRAAVKEIDDQTRRYAELQALGDEKTPGPLAVLLSLAAQLRGQLGATDRQLTALRRASAKLDRREQRLQRLIADAQTRREDDQTVAA